MDLNWTASPDAVRDAIYRSTDGAGYTYFGAAASGATTFSATGLTPNTLYWWKVYAVSEGAPSAGAASGSQATSPAGDILSTPAGGPWSAAATWVGGVVPTSNDNVTIADGSTVTIDAASTPNAYSLTVGQGTSGILLFNTTTARTLTIVQSLTVAPGGTFQTGAATGVTTHIVSVGQDVTNNGTIDFSTTATNAAGAGFIFTGGSDATFTNNGTLDLRNTVGSNGGLHLNKGSGQAAILDFVQNSAANVTTQEAQLRASSPSPTAPSRYRAAPPSATPSSKTWPTQSPPQPPSGSTTPTPPSSARTAPPPTRASSG